MRRTILAAVGGVIAGALIAGGTVAIATPSDPCESAYTAPMNSTKKLKQYTDCRADRQDAALKRIEGKLGTLPSATPSASPSATPSPSASQTPTPTPTLDSPSPEPSATPSATASATPSPSATPTPTASPSETPKPDADGCVGAANTPGGPDPWGGCWPGPHNTGYPQGLPGDTRTPVKLTNYTGPTTIRSCGVVIDSKIVPETIILEAGTSDPKNLDKPCLTIRNSLVKGVIFAESRSYGPMLIEDTEVAPPDLPWWENIGRSNYRAVRVNSHGGEGVIKCDSNCEAVDNWVHGMRLGKAYHYNAFGGNDTQNFLIEHNWASCGDWSSVEAGVQGDAGCSAAIGFYGDWGPTEDVTIHRNMLVSNTAGSKPADGWRQAGYCLNPGYYPGKPYGTTARVKVTDNVFAKGTTGKCGVYGPSNSLNAAGKPAGNEWSNNTYTDGTVITRPEE